MEQLEIFEILEKIDDIDSEKFIKKVFHERPYGIGSRKLFPIECRALEGIYKLEGEDDNARDLVKKLLAFYRCGDISIIDQDEEEQIRYSFNIFVGSMRKEFINSGQTARIMDVVLGSKGKASEYLDNELNEICALVATYNSELEKKQLLVGSGMDLVVRNTILRFIELGMRDPTIMFLQSMDYYDGRARFAFDKYILVWDDIEIYWRQWLGKEEDDVLDFQGWNYFYQYLPDETIYAMRYYSKYNYQVYCHRRRQIGTLLPEELDEFGVITVNYNSLWCSKHREYRHDCVRDPGITILMPNPGEIDSRVNDEMIMSLKESNEEEEDVKSIYRRAAREEDEVVLNILNFDSTYFEQVYVLFNYVDRKSLAFDGKSFFNRNKVLLKMGGVSARARLDSDAKHRISLYFRQPDKWRMRFMNPFDPNDLDLGDWEQCEYYILGKVKDPIKLLENVKQVVDFDVQLLRDGCTFVFRHQLPNDKRIFSNFLEEKKS